jgi:hypothetical protein
MKIEDKRTRRVLCRSIRIATNVAKRATMQTSVPMGTMMTRHQLDRVPATTAGLRTAVGGMARMMVSGYSKQEA